MAPCYRAVRPTPRHALDARRPSSSARAGSALLELVRQLDAWEAGSLATLSLARIEDAVAGLKESLLSYPNLPNHREQTDYVLGVLRGWGVDVDDPFVRMDVEDGFRYDHERGRLPGSDARA